MSDTLRDALARLVGLEDMRLRLLGLHERGHGTDYDGYRKALPVAWDRARAALAAAEQPAATPAATWRATGESDPHENRYDCERAALPLGKLTDDELANAVFMHYDARPPIQDILDGKAFSPIAYVTAAKERIRWLSRALVKATDRAPPGPAHPGAAPDDVGVAIALEQQRALKIVQAVERLASERDPNMMSPHWIGWMCACEEVTTRICHEEWSPPRERRRPRPPPDPGAP